MQFGDQARKLVGEIRSEPLLKASPMRAVYYMDYVYFITFYHGGQPTEIFTEAKEKDKSADKSNRKPSARERAAAFRKAMEQAEADIKAKVEAPFTTKSGVPFIDAMSLTELQARPDLGQDSATRKAYQVRMHGLAAQHAAELTAVLKNRREVFRAAKAQRRLERRGKILTESKEVGEMSMGGIDHTETHQNVQDHTGEASDRVTVGSSIQETGDGSGTQYSLNSFFERPVAIYDATWDSGTEYNVNFEPWDLWSKDTSVRAKLANYSYFKGTMHIKIATTGTPYHYGTIMASYQPYGVYNQNLIKYDEMMNATTPGPGPTLPAYKCYLSQAPGVAYIDVKENQPVELEIPFISHKPKFRLFNNSPDVITNATSFVDFKEAGELRLVTLNKLAVANDDFDSDVSLNIYAWVTDVELGNITATDMDITAQSKDLTIFTEGRPKKKGFNRDKAEGDAKAIRKKAEQLEDELSSDDDDDSYNQRWSKEEDTRHKTWAKSKEDKPMYGKGNFGERFMTSLEKGGDEYATPGPVANIATAVSNIGNSLKDIPVIGGFAKATSTIANGVGRVASWFGWSKPLVLDDPTFVKTIPFANGAVTIGKDTPHKISIDPKQELTVDPTLGGMDDDQMALLNITSRESYLTTFTWSDNDVAMTTILWKTFVTPYLGQYFSSGTTLFQPTALSFAAQPFMYWRGKIKFRFEVVCSKFHRGKILFKFDPNVAMHALISSGSTKLNQQNTVILDIQDAQDITIEVDWAHVRNWASVPSPYALPYTNSEAPIRNLSPTEANGFLEVRPLNELVQPTDSAEVAINVFVSSDDMQFNLMNPRYLPFQRNITTESMDVSSDTINPNDSKVDEKIFLNHFGEKIFSFRQLLKRYVTTDGAQNVSGDQEGLGLITCNGTLYPTTLTRHANDDNGQVIGLFDYLRYAYMGVRGGYRHRILINTGHDITRSSYTRVTLDEQSLTDAFFNTGSFKLTSPEPYFDIYYNTINGALMFHHHTNGGIEFELPFYSENLFLLSFAEDYGYNSAEPGIGFSTSLQNASYSVETTCTLKGVQTTVITDDTAPAEDFTFLRFQGAPFYTESADITDDMVVLPEGEVLSWSYNAKDQPFNPTYLDAQRVVRWVVGAKAPKVISPYLEQYEV
ncbi:capsid protein precursor [Aurantiochytrium single-stranded RNA virus 01]|uniref:capsid protein precursor n=1 Tax=Aurantiochytrium single-stranded RNA virus 01 TaxID=674971 RepID=UPI00005E2750|nr:capsid protein precursor [Aurantiochytrium single-stranded RNA virus 01]